MKQINSWVAVLWCLMLGSLAHAQTQPQIQSQMASSTNTPVVTTSWIQVNGVSLRYELSGTGTDTLVLLHEMGMSLESFDAIMLELRKTHRVLRYDLRGFGLSEKINGAVTFDDEVADLRALLGALRLEGKVTLIGGAIGGATALAYAATYPDQVKGVVAISPAAGTAPAARAGTLARAALVERTTMKAILDSDLEAIYPKSIQKPEAVARFKSIQLGTDLHSMAASLRMIAITDFNVYYPKITAPTLVIAAELYEARPVASVKLIADSIAKGQFASLPTGHFIPLQSPELLMPVLNRFLAQLR